MSRPVGVFGVSEAQFFTFLLIFLRVGALFVFAPAYSTPFIPTMVRAALVLGLSLCLAVLGVAGEVPVPGSLSVFVAYVAQEILLGMLLGFVANLIFVAAQFGGQVVGVDMGLGIVSVLDPQFETQVSIMSQVQFVLAILLFLAVGGDRMLITSFAASFQKIAPGQLVLSGRATEVLITLTGSIFATGLRIAAPIIAALFATNVILGIFARSVPQMNMLILGFPLKILVGFLVLGLSLPYLARVVLQGIDGMFQVLDRLPLLLR